MLFKIFSPIFSSMHKTALTFLKICTQTHFLPKRHTLMKYTYNLMSVIYYKRPHTRHTRNIHGCLHTQVPLQILACLWGEWVCVCVCVCACERERESESKEWVYVCDVSAYICVSAWGECVSMCEVFTQSLHHW